MLEGAAHVELHVSLPRARRHRGGRDRAAAWADQYDARRFAKPLAEADAAARAAAVRRHHRYYGDNLGSRPLGGEAVEDGTHFMGAARMYSTFSFCFAGFFFFLAAE